MVKHMRLMNFDVDVVHRAAKRKWNLLCSDYTGDYKELWTKNWIVTQKGTVFLGILLYNDTIEVSVFGVS